MKNTEQLDTRYQEIRKRLAQIRDETIRLEIEQDNLRQEAIQIWKRMHRGEE